MYFDQCMGFLARMIEKYGAEVQLPKKAKTLSNPPKTEAEEYRDTDRQKA